MASVIDNFPDISFIDNEQITAVLNRMISNYQQEYKRITGKDVDLAQADPFRLILYACTMEVYQGMQYVDRAGKMSFLKYSDGDFLDNLGALRGVSRYQARPATVVLNFSIPQAMTSAVAVPEGTRVTNGSGVFFATDETVEIAAGQTSVSVSATCTVAGTSGNGFAPGEISILVETLAYVTDVANTNTSEGGEERETDDAFRERIYEAPGAYSVAGPADAYEYFAKQADASITDAVAYSSTPGQVDICIVCNGNEAPSQEVMDKVEDYLMDSSVRPLTDYVVVHAPTTQTYNVNVTYYVGQSDSSALASIQEAVNRAIANYNTWQTGKLGRDINPSALIQRVMEAGAKRIEVTSPARTTLAATDLASVGTVTVTYGGLEAD